METLSRLVKLITRKRIKKIELFDESSRNKSSNYFKLFEGIHSGKYTTDFDAARSIYECEPSEKKFLILKTRLKQKLINTLFFVEPDQRKTLPLRAAIYESNKSLYMAKVLLMNGTVPVAISFLERTLKQAQEFHLTAIELESAKLLRNHASAQLPYKNFLFYKNYVEKVEIKLAIENKAQANYQEVRALFIKSKSNKEKVKEIAQKYYCELEPLVAEYNCPAVYLNYIKIKALYCQLSNDYIAALSLIDQAEKYIYAHPKLYGKTNKALLVLQKINYYLHLKDFENGQKLVTQRERYFNKGSERWLTFMEYYFLLAMHTDNYSKAADIFQSVIKQTNFKKVSRFARDRWKVFQAYLYFISRYFDLKDIKQHIQTSKFEFRLLDFMNDKSKFSKKRRGLNINRLVLQILLSLEKYDEATIGKYIDNLLPYSRRYPKKDLNFRSECLIGIIKNMRDESFKYYQTRKASEKPINDMAKNMMLYIRGNGGLEVLPFEKVQNIIFDKLKEYS